jgi:hypothetical protein
VSARGSFNRGWSVLLSFAGICALAGCSVDERKLVPPPLEEVGPSAGGAGGVSGDDGWSGCDDSGDSGASDRSRCWSFDHDTEGWTAESGIVRAFSPDDASNDPASGSLSITNRDVGPDAQMQTAGAYRCVVLPYAEKFSLELEVLVPAQPVAGGASVELQFINIPGCQGIILGHPQFADPAPLSWYHLQAKGDVPRGARSLLLRLLVGKFHDDPTFVARFDQIRLVFE